MISIFLIFTLSPLFLLLKLILKTPNHSIVFNHHTFNSSRFYVMRRISIYFRKEIFLFKIILKKIDNIQKIIISNIIKFLVIKISKNYRIIRRLWIEKFQFKHVYSFYYFNARLYDPTLGIFITEDPIIDGNNWYTYCNNDPINYIDPLGLCKKSSEDIKDLSIEDKIKLLGEYGNAYELAEPAFSAYDPNAEPEFKRDTYVDHFRLATLGAMLTPLADETAGNLRVTKFPSFGSNVTSVGDTSLSVWSKDGDNVSYQVTTVTSSQVADGLVAGTIEGDVSVTFTAVIASESQAESILKWTPELVDKALGIEDTRSKGDKVIDELF